MPQRPRMKEPIVIRTSWLAAPALAVALGLAGCGGSDNSSSGSSGASGSSGSSGSSTKTPSSSSSSAGGGSALKLAADPSGNLSFDTKTLSAKAGKVTVAFTNASSVPHAVEIEGKGVEVKTKVITGGKASVATKLKPGTYEFYCPVDGHRMAGMEGKLTVK
jgi:plastocyanin